MRGEKPGEYKAYLAFRETGDLEDGYKKYMQDNIHAGLSFNKYVELSSIYHWIVRTNNYEAAEELRIRRETRRKAIANDLSAEEVKKELFTVCLEQLELTAGDMEHHDIVKYLELAVKINKTEDPAVVVNNLQDNKNIDIDPEILKELGKKLVIDHDRDTIQSTD